MAAGGTGSLLRHPGLAQAGEIRGFQQSPDLRRPPPCKGSQAADARKTTVHSQPAGFGELGGGASGFASEGIGSGEATAVERHRRGGAPRFFEPDYRLVDVQLQQIRGSNQAVTVANVIARTEANGLLEERRHLV